MVIESAVSFLDWCVLLQERMCNGLGMRFSGTSESWNAVGLIIMPHTVLNVHPYARM